MVEAEENKVLQATESEKRNENGFRNILKGTTIFGSVQLFQILIGLIRGKFVAMLLGPSGMGVSSMMSSVNNSLVNFSSLGLNLAFVREVAEHKGERGRLAEILTVVSTLGKITALIGAFVTALLSPLLSQLSFGSDEYTWQFLLLSVAVYLMVEGGAKMSVIQGLHKVKILSATSLIGALVGLVVGVPLYWLWGTKGIVPAMVVLALSSYICFSIGLRRAVDARGVRFEWSRHKNMVKKVVTLGMVLLSSTLINSLCIYALNVYIRVYGDLADVGLFNAANSITNQYATLVFTAMSMDYFPRLSAVASDPRLMPVVVNRQMIVVSAIIAPAALLLVILSPIAIRVLLTGQFLEITSLMRWMGVGVLLKGIAFPLGFIAFAKNNRTLFFWMEAVGCNVIYILFAIAFYSAFGLIGLGYSLVAENTACLLLYLIVNYKVYGYRPDAKTLLFMIAAIVAGFGGFGCSFIPRQTASYIAMSAVFAVSTLFSVLLLKRLLRSDAAT